MATPGSPPLLQDPVEAISGKLNDQLTCNICLERYNNPRLLICHHAFCKDCIAQLQAQLPEMERHTVACPSCRKPTQLGDKGALGLPAAFHINNFLEIDKVLKESTENQQKCLMHKNRLMEIYCETCEELICIKCMSSHREHRLIDADNLYEESLTSIDEQINEVEKMLEVYDEIEKEIQDQTVIVKKEINLTTQQLTTRLQELMKEVQQSRETLLDQLETKSYQKLQLHSVERADVETVLAKLKSCKEYVKNELRSQSQHHIQTARKLVQHITKTHSAVKMSELSPGQKADITFVRSHMHSSNVLAANKLNLLGSVTSSLNYQSVSGLFSIDIPQQVLALQTTEVSLTTLFSLPVESLSCTLQSENEHLIYPACQVIQVDEGHFKATLKPQHSGPHWLRIKINGDEIGDSPFKVPVISLAKSRKQAGLKVLASGLQHPCGIAVTNDGKHVVVTEGNRDCVTVLSAANGEVIRRVGRRGNSPERFIEPIEVVVSADNHVFVTDKRRVQKFTLDGACVASIERSLAFNFSCGTALLSNGNLLICSATEEMIHEITPDLREISSFSRQVPSEPYTLAVGTNNIVYLLTYENRLYKFIGSKRKNIASNGNQPHQLQSPFDFCIDCTNTLYITDGHQVKMFSSDGEFLGSFGNHPKLRGIVANKTGDLFICKASGEVLVSALCVHSD